MRSIFKIFFVLVAIFILTAPFVWALDLEWDFRSSKDTLGWSKASPSTNLKNEGGRIITESLGAPIYLSSPPLMVFPEDFDTLILRMKNNADGYGNVFWNTSVDKNFEQSKSVLFSLGKKDIFHTYYINLKAQNTSWAFRIDQIVLNPSQFGSQAEFEHIKLVKGDFLSNILSSWQEFFGPTGRIITGRSINSIYASNIMGHSVNLYLYFLLAFSGILALSYYFIRSNDPATSWQKTGSLLIMATLIFWAMLEINFMFNQFVWAKKDYSTFFGKSIEEKNQADNPGEFYAFIKFCEKNIPEDALVYFPSNDPNNTAKWHYFLCPRAIVSAEGEAEYSITYNAAAPSSKTFGRIKSFGPGKEIYKRL